MKTTNQIEALDLELCGFRQSIGPSQAWCRRFDTGVDGTQCELRFLPDDDGWIVEVWNWQDDEPGSVEQRVALPRLLTDLADLTDLLRIFQPAKE